MTDGTRVEWRPWGEAAFDEARRTGAPVLLALTATWCGECHEMDARTYGEPRIAANLNDGFVPVRVDVDRHPRVRERYNVGGFPATVFCTPSGERIASAGFLGPDGMRDVLDRVRERWDTSGAEAGRLPRALADDDPPRGPVTDRIEGHLAGQVEGAFDAEYGGWGDAPKFPLPRTVEFALKRDRSKARQTLDAVTRGLFDEDAGGFYRYARTRDWGDPDRAKLLADNAALVRAFAHAYCYTGEDAYRRPAERTVEYLIDALWNGSAFGGSQGPTEAESDTGPRTDLTAFADANALAVDALLTLSAYTDAERPREYARRTLSTLRSAFVADDGTVRHRADDGAPTLVLADQAWTVAAGVRATQVLGDEDALALARRVADRTVEGLFDDGSFRDGPAEGPGLLDRPFRPLDGNVEMADALLDLAALTGEDRYREVARDAVAAFAGAWDRLGVQVAGYGAVAARLLGDPLVIEVGTDPGSDLHRAALRVADHEKVVHPGAADPAPGSARVTVGDRSRTVETPAALAEAVAAVAGE
ncbi:DUF255 domain-containing protein [Haloplanus halophilus]|uniref:DUF255 domain-containing protein n=1 Tax=Haloplanus halophilus TaxID=2949993 RepID=UPI0020425777|nr:DUF255 domain-containing protein [Haloplanus sp. GDY1]